MWGWCWDKLQRYVGSCFWVWHERAEGSDPSALLQDRIPTPSFLPTFDSWPGSHTPSSLLISRNLKPSPHHPYFRPEQFLFFVLWNSARFKCLLLQRATPNAHPSGQGVSALRPQAPLLAPVSAPPQDCSSGGLGCTQLCPHRTLNSFSKAEAGTFSPVSLPQLASWWCTWQTAH